ncbi:nucleotidyltransferase domain-containing protein [Candidatus Sumerlaeota bacterium]|nr:nucleotidyltransferase domain-containing protein [Candidatus Sumerlaeota bacterium]
MEITAAVKSGTTLKSIQAYCNRVGREFNPEKIILLGSHAYGKPARDSDVDLMVIMPFKGKGRDKSAEIRARASAPFPMDMIVRTPRQIEKRLAGEDWFIAEIIERGRVMYEAAHAGVDRKG